MPYQLIDFDEKLAEYMHSWMQAHRGDYQKIEEMEADVPAATIRWLNEPAGWLGGKAPGRYFDDFSDGAELTGWMLAYIESGVSVPGPLLDRIAALGQAAPLVSYLRQALAEPVRGKQAEAAMTCISLLMQMESDEAAGLYIDYIVKAGDGVEVADAASEALCQLPQARDAMIEALDRPMGEAARTALLDALVHLPPHPAVYRWLKRMFMETEQQKALYASYLGKYGDDEAVGLLLQAAQEPELNYLEYLEIRNAIEALGGECTVERTFDGDRYYESMKGI